MKQITYVKLYHGEIINITTPPKEDYHYEIEDNILWIVPNHQMSRAHFMHIVSAGSIIARGVNEKEVNITMPLDFQYYRMWCTSNGFKMHDAETLVTYVNRFDTRDELRVRTI